MKSYTVKRKVTFSAFVPTIAILAVTLAVALIAVRVFALFSYLLIALGTTVAIVLIPHFIRTEYEYNLEGDSLSVALIRNNSSRKELFCCDIPFLVSCEMYKNQPIQGVKVDVTGGDNPSYIAVFSEDGKVATLLFSPNDAFMQEMRLLAPSKVKLNILY